MNDKSAMERMKEYAESWLDVGPEYSRGQIVEGMVNKARELLREEQAQKPPTDMAGLVEEVEGWLKRFSSNYPALSELREILSRYRPVHYSEPSTPREQNGEVNTAPASDKKWHDLKVVSPHWEALKANIKPFEIRKNDRDYKVGDGLALRHWRDGEYVVNEAPQYFVVEYITDFPDGIKEGYVVMGLSRYRPAVEACLMEMIGGK